MPKRTDIKSILVIGAGPIVIGQACEFDYSGVQACKALKDEGYRVILVNSNPATIMTDPGLADATYDVVYTGGYVAAWVCDLQRYYREAARILKPNGLLIVSEYHPFRRVFRRPWSHSPSSLEIAFNYFDRGPHRFEAAPDVLYLQPGELEQFELHWTVADYITAILASGCQLVDAEEFGDTCGEWEGAPMAGLPGSLLLVARRDG